ncbi:MAG: EAL domain-containing response regulator [Enterobacterales bacterium]|nr:EAL domain-containing response regulator [Enterobacterales bacterium]
MNKVTIYILDDEPEMLALLGDMVEDLDLQAQCFNDAVDFFNQVKSFPINSLLVLDLNMPNMDGIQVMRQLAGVENAPALILISGHDIGVLHSAEKLGNAHNLKIVSSLDKPIHLVQFQNLIEVFCNEIKNETTQKPHQAHDIAKIEEIIDAIKQDQMCLYYQPQISIDTGQIIACEALVRWQHPSKGLVFPDEFIPELENYQEMALLTNWVIKEAVKQEQTWQDQSIKLPISVNISADDITSLSLPEQLSSMLSENRFSPKMLTLEVTESALMGELVTSLDILTRLRLKGIGLSIDDFGTGYSSLSQLHKIPFSELKIDRSFVLSMLEDREAKAIVKTCIMLGHELDMNIVAEGVETLEHFECLKEMGCDIAQGYYFSRPIPAEQLSELIKRSSNSQ